MIPDAPSEQGGVFSWQPVASPTRPSANLTPMPGLFRSLWQTVQALLVRANLGE
jgi:hypothetical protein